jgi:uncharacterized membrane protein
MEDGREARPLGRVVGETMRHGSALAQLDLKILQAETKQKALSVLSSGAYGITALIFFLLAGFALVEFLILAIVLSGISAVIASLIVCGVLVVAGSISLLLAKRAVAGFSLVPAKTVEQVKSDLAALMRGIRYGAGQ